MNISSTVQLQVTYLKADCSRLFTGPNFLINGDKLLPGVVLTALSNPCPLLVALYLRFFIPAPLGTSPSKIRTKHLIEFYSLYLYLSHSHATVTEKSWLLASSHIKSVYSSPSLSFVTLLRNVAGLQIGVEYAN